MAKILFIGTHGTDDPTRATFPFMEAKGAIEAGHETGIILMMEAVPLIKDRIAAQVQGIGVPPLKELMDFLFARNVRDFCLRTQWSCPWGHGRRLRRQEQRLRHVGGCRLRRV